MRPSSDCKKVAKTIVFIGNKNVNLSYPASFTRLLDLKKDIGFSRSFMGRKNKHCFINTDRPKVNSENYIQLLDDNLLPGCRRIYPRNNYVFHQNGASSHTRRETQAHLEEATQDSSRRMNGLHKVQNVTKWMTEYGTLRRRMFNEG